MAYRAGQSRYSAPLPPPSARFLYRPEIKGFSPRAFKRGASIAAASRNPRAEAHRRPLSARVARALYPAPTARLIECVGKVEEVSRRNRVLENDEAFYEMNTVGP
jgi:hypothetical protein